EIECSYLECLVEEVPEGTPSFVCSRLRNYGWCRYVYGEIFQVLPFANFVHDFVGTISRVLSNPLSALLGISQWFCSGLIPEGAAKHGYCNVVKQIVQWGDTLQDIHTIFKTDWKLQKDACEDVLKSVDEKLDSNFQMPGAESSLIGEGFEEEETPSGGSSPTQPGGVGVSGG
ncbi:hypothetical protein HYS48_04615, partial [Candidatus Woesearchaeota archaeon]|nr:hypothetical protein [Candidatus Woesearchaeota archaeon]